MTRCMLVLSILVVGCTESRGPVDSGQISLTINSINPSDIRTAGTVSKDENISTESGNPWGAFARAAKDECGGDPVAFEVLTTTMSLDVDGSDNVAAFEDVISGAATVYFLSTSGSDATATRADVASAATVTGIGPVTMSVGASRTALEPLLDRLVGGDFHVGLRAATALTDDDDFSMDVQIALSARAFCE